MSDLTITVVSHADNRGEGCRTSGKRVPLVQVLISEWGDVHSASFPPELAPEIAEAILKAGRAAKRGKRSEKILAIRNED